MVARVSFYKPGQWNWRCVEQSLSLTAGSCQWYYSYPATEHTNDKVMGHVSCQVQDYDLLQEKREKLGTR